MPFVTPPYPFDPALIDASLRDTPRPTPHAPVPALDGIPIVLGGVLRSDSPFLDAMPLGGTPLGEVIFGERMLGEMAPVDGMLLVPLVPVTPEPLDAAPTEPPAPEAPFDRAAVERARARAARVVERVEATVMSDDGVAEHVCDVTAWLAGATAREVEALARAGWAGGEAEEVAATLADDDPEVADVLCHARRADAGVVVEIDGRAAVAWLARHRPAVADALDDTHDDGPDEPPDES